MKFNKILLIILVFIICMFAIMLTTSYAWYSFSSGNTSFDVATNNDDIKVTYKTGMYINTTTAIPITNDEVISKADKNNFGIDLSKEELVGRVLVSVSLVDLEIDKNLKDSSFKYDLVYNDSVVSSGNFSKADKNEFMLADSITLESLNNNNFELRLYVLDNGENQNSLMNKKFKGTIAVNVVSRLKTNITQVGSDILISSIIVDGQKTVNIPTNGTYSMVASCKKGSSLEWNPVSKTISYTKGSKSGDSCSLIFTTDKDYNYQLLSEMSVGSYVKYQATGGKVGNNSTNCNISASSSKVGDGETEAPNSCNGQNAREDLEEKNNGYGYCTSEFSKYTTTGWRIAYIDKANGGQVVLISAGAPECVSISNLKYAEKLNTKALKYCNSKFVDGNCTCRDNDNDGLCDSPSSDTWALNSNDFYNIVSSGKHLVGTTNINNICYGEYSNPSCGYNNDLLDNGGSYLFNEMSSNSIVLWKDRHVDSANNFKLSYGLRPVIKLSKTVKVISGTGTMDDPFVINN